LARPQSAGTCLWGPRPQDPLLAHGPDVCRDARPLHQHPSRRSATSARTSKPTPAKATARSRRSSNFWP
jgi:hypothetical protein